MTRSAILILILLKASSIQMKSVARLSGLVVSLGQTAEMRCLMKCDISSSQWTFTAYGQTSKPVVLYTYERGLDNKTAVRANVSLEANGELVMNISNTHLTDVGLYTCKRLCPDRDGKKEIAEEVTELVALDGQPKCLSNLSEIVTEGERIQMKCEVFYRGSWAPVIAWRQNGQDIPILEGGSQINITSNVGVTSVLTILTSYSTNKAAYTCSTQFTHYVGEVNSTLTVLPRYSHACTWPKLSVKYKPRDLKIFPQQSSFVVGEELMCSSNANPGALYEWKDLRTGHVVQGSVFKLEENMTNQETTYMYLLCNATNDISYATLSLNVTVSVKRTQSVGLQLILASVPTSVLLLLALVIIVYLVHSKRSGTHSGDKEAKDRVEKPDPIESPCTKIDNEASDTASYTSIPSIEVGQEHAAEDAPNTSESPSMYQERNVDRYSKLEAREVPLPPIYSRLGKSKRAIPDDANNPRENDYTNENRQQQSEDYYNIEKPLIS